jgi:hypothetical protein
MSAETEESPLLEVVAREWLVKTELTRKGSVGVVEISGGTVITCSSELCVQVSINPFTNPYTVYCHP